MAEPFRFERRARRPFGIAMVAVAVLFLGVLVFALDASPLVVALFALITAPAVWEVLRDSRAWLKVDDTALTWQAGARRGNVALAQIDEVVLSTTFDLAPRARVRLKSGERFRLPMECLPPGRALDAALEARGVSHRRAFFAG